MTSAIFTDTKPDGAYVGPSKIIFAFAFTVLYHSNFKNTSYKTLHKYPLTN